MLGIIAIYITCYTTRAAASDIEECPNCGSDSYPVRNEYYLCISCNRKWWYKKPE